MMNLDLNRGVRASSVRFLSVAFGLVLSLSSAQSAIAGTRPVGRPHTPSAAARGSKTILYQGKLNFADQDAPTIRIADTSVNPFNTLGIIHEHPKNETIVQNLSVAPNGDLYAVHVWASPQRVASDVEVFPRAQTHRSERYVSPAGMTAGAVAVDRQGTVYIGYYPSANSCGSNFTIEVFAKGHKTPTGSIGPFTTTFSCIFGLTTDSHNNLYVVYAGAGGGGTTDWVSKFAKGSTTGTTTIIAEQYFGATNRMIAVDSKGDVLLPFINGGTRGGIGVFPPGQSTPSMILSGSPGNPGGNDGTVALNADETVVYGDWGQLPSPSCTTCHPEIAEWSYPSGQLILEVPQKVSDYALAAGF